MSADPSFPLRIEAPPVYAIRRAAASSVTNAATTQSRRTCQGRVLKVRNARLAICSITVAMTLPGIGHHEQR